MRRCGYGGECADMVHAEAEDRILGALEEWSMCGGHRPSACEEEQERRLPGLGSQWRDCSIACQSAFDRDPRSASKRDPLVLRFERLAFAPSEVVGVAETGRARVDV